MVRQAETEDKEVVAAQPKRVRVPFGVPRTKLDVAKHIEGYHLHWVNDEAGRITQAQDGGYEFVTPAEVGVPAKPSDEQKVKRIVGKSEDGSGMYAYLMKIRQDWYEEDQKKAQSIQDQFELAIRQGKIEQAGGDRRYIPDGGISIKS